MLKIRALNRESSSDEDAPTIRKEAQEEIALDVYNKALRLQCNGSLEEAQCLLQDLIQKNIPQLENQGGLPKTMSTLKYSCYINIGSIAFNRGEIMTALDNYLEASELDKTDVTLWCKIGKLALELNRFRQASYAFIKGLDCNESHWPCLDQLITLLFAMNDTIACLQYIGKALVLDPEYMKGLVLRKKIYENNPATKEYYQLFNPDYILEPDLNISVEEDDETEILEQVEKLSSRIREVEKALEPQPLPTIPLRKPLDEYTWLALGLTLVDLHQYVSENNMSHFSMVDLSKCMSHKCDESSLEKMEIIVEANENQNVNSQCAQNVEVMDCNEDDQKQITPIGERRSSQNSDNCGNEVPESVTPVQTDENDEMEQDGEDQDENLESKQDKNRPQNRGTKRRRDLLSDLQIWGWHSKRKSSKKGKYEKDLTVEDAFRRIIPSHLKNESKERQEDNTSTSDSNNMQLQDKNRNILSPFHSPKHPIEFNYFGSENETQDVLAFWNKKWECCDVVTLIEEYVYSLSKLWNVKWPCELIQVYIEAYEMFREHCDHPELNNEELIFEEIRNDAFVTILYGEFLFFNNKIFTSNRMHCTSINFISLVSGWEEQWEKEFSSFFLRVHWLRAHIFERENNITLAIRYLHLLKEVILTEEEKTGNKYSLHLLNTDKCSIIDNEVIEKLLQHLEMIDSLSHVERLYNNEEYIQVAEVLKSTFLTTNHPVCGKMGRPAQIGMLLHSLWYTNLTECFVWAEECLHEALLNLLQVAKDLDKWEMIVQKCLAMLVKIIQSETVSIIDFLNEDRRCRLVDSLTRLIQYQLNKENVSLLPLGTVTPWIVLHYVLLRDEHRQQARKKTSHIKKDDVNSCQNNAEDEHDESDLPPSIAILFSGHEFFGPKGWCTSESGELLHFILDTILDRLDTPIFESRREKIDLHIEQALFCLYQHPSKKNKVSRHLADHNVNPLPLTWERSHQLYQFYCPDALPEFDSYRSISITSDVEQLLQRIYSLVPPECNPQPLLPKINDFVQGISDKMPKTIDFPHKVRAIYYLLGDYYFKQNEVNQSIKYFLLDLCINPLRLDAWACLALGFASQLESKLNHCEKLKNENEFLDKAKSAQICFKQALKLASDHITLWIEFGSFEYMVHSFCSRLLKYESDTLSMEKFEILENLKETYLNSSCESFLKALSLHQPDRCDADERWLYHYMLAKISEKKQREPIEYLQHYLTAAALLNENNAVYPEKINYNNPQHLSVEALEVHYRIHASILKYLEVHEGKTVLSSTGKIFKRCLDSSTFPKKNYAPPKAVENPQKSEQSNADKTTESAIKKDDKQSEESKILSDVKKCIEDMLRKIEETDKKAIKLNEPVQEELKTENITQKISVKDAQEIMDALMLETMKKNETVEDTESESNYDTVEASDVKVCKNDSVEHVKSQESKTESDSKTSVPNVAKGKNEQNIRKSLEDSSSTVSSSSASSSSDESDSDDSSSSSTSTSSDASSGNMSDSDVIHLIDRCIAGLEQCIIRLPQNYKALYRLAHLYFHYGPKKDISKCRQLLLGEYKCKCSVLVSGLFSDRKTNNIFNGVWRIPSSEIDRPGSLAAHMGRCVSLLLQILRASNDHKTLLDLCLQLKRTPDPDKIYIRDTERLQLSEQAMSLCVQTIRTQIKNLNSKSQGAMQKLLLDVFRIYQRVQKHMPPNESTFATMLTDIYKIFMQNKIPENVNVMDLALKFCQQHRPAEKQKQQLHQPVLPRSSISSFNVPVLPTPTTNPIMPSIPLKRPGIGRPRGRPPGPKLNRPPKGRGGSNLGTNPFMWQNPLYDPRNAYDYLKQYQEQLIRQYTQNLSYTQLTQLGHLFSQGHNTLLTANNLLQNLRQPSPSTADILSNLNMGPKKKSALDILPVTSGHNFTADQLRHFNLQQSIASQFNVQTTAQSQNKVRSVFTMPTFTKGGSSSYKYSTADNSKSKTKSVTKTTSSYQLHKELSSTSTSHKQKTEFDNIYMKDRPNISITPVTQTMPTNIPKTNTSPVANTSGKTLQEKLAEKQKQLSSKNLAAKAVDQPKSKDPKNVVNLIIPSSLTVTKTSSTTSSFPPSDSGISVGISTPADLTVTPTITMAPKQSEPSDLSMSSKQTTSSDISNLIMFRKEPIAPKSASPTHKPMSISVFKQKPEAKPLPKQESSDDDVIIIE